jgi:anti-anti-sigma factor
MNVSLTNRNDYLIIGLQGRLDTLQADAVEKKMLEVLGQKHERIVIDCKELDYISSSGLRIFLIMQKKMMGAAGTLKLCNLQPSIQEVFDMSGFSMIFAIAPDLETALQDQ